MCNLLLNPYNSVFSTPCREKDITNPEEFFKVEDSNDNDILSDIIINQSVMLLMRCLPVLHLVQTAYLQFYLKSVVTNFLSLCKSYLQNHSLRTIQSYRVSNSRLFNVLLDNNVCPYIVRMLCYMYLNQNCCVKWNSKSSTYFCVSNRVKQGAVISPILFSSYMDALFERLKRNAIGCHVGPVYAGTFGYADDVALVAPSLYSLRCMIATCEEFANEYQIDFNPTI